MRDKFKNIQKKEFKIVAKKLILFIFLLCIFYKWNSIEEFFKHLF